MGKKEVLIIDDDEGFQFYLAQLFKKKYPSVDLLQAYDGKEATEMLATSEQLPELIFLDINMPVMNGIEFLEHRQAQFKANEIKIVVITSSHSDRDKELMRKFSYVDDFIVKPVFERAIKKHIENL